MKQSLLIALVVLTTLNASYAQFFLKGIRTKVFPVSDDLREIYNQWKIDYNIKIDPSEEDYRFKVFSSNYEMIQKHNADPTATTKYGLNQFTHLTAGDFHALNYADIDFTNLGMTKTDNITGEIPAEWDWEKLEKVSPVFDQGQCASSYASAAVAAVESLIAINHGEVTQLSTQEVLDCAQQYGGYYCMGGNPTGVFMFMRYFGIVNADNYTYNGQVEQCQHLGDLPRTFIGDYSMVNTSETLKAAVSKNPVFAMVNIKGGLQFYQSGILESTNCSQETTQGVLVVGYGTENGTEFWKVKNSWGTKWGEDGYFRIQRNSGACGIEQMGIYPLKF